jgi:hypothetical protein
MAVGQYHRTKIIVSVAACLVLLCAGIWLVFAHTVHVDRGYRLETRFKTLPPDDKALKAWLNAQPGVVPERVAVSRFDTDKKRVAVLFIHVHNMAGQPPIPNLNEACAALGYRDPEGPFHPSKEDFFRDDTGGP